MFMSLLFNQGNKNIRETKTYQAGTPIEEVERQLGIKNIIKLASNENPLGPSPRAIYAAKKSIENVHIYPDASDLRLRQAIAKYNKVDIQNITVGNGSENCIECLNKAFLNSTSHVIVDEYCFATIRILNKAYNATEIVIPSINYRLNVDEVIRQIDNDTRMIYIINPNNPTGTFTTQVELVRILENTPPHVVVVVDEAYHEYINHKDYPHSVVLLAKYPNLVISRTFSKVFGLAGMRLGYLISAPNVADLLQRSRLPFNVNNYAVEAGIVALEDHVFIERTIQTNNNGMKQLLNAFNNADIESIPSVANFITINTKRDGVDVYNQLLQKGLIVRPLVPYGLPQHLRITIGTFEQNEKLIEALNEVLYA